MLEIRNWSGAADFSEPSRPTAVGHEASSCGPVCQQL